MGYTKLKTFCIVKEMKNTEWNKIFINNLSDKGLMSKMQKELIQLNRKKFD